MSQSRIKKNGWLTLAPSTHAEKMSTHPPVSKQRKWAKRAYWSVTLVAFVWLCLLLTNEVFYARVLPASSDSFLWRGGWDSDKHLTLNGRVDMEVTSRFWKLPSRQFGDSA